MKKILLSFISFYFIVGISAQTTNIIYVSPTGGGNGSSIDAPTTIQQAFGSIQAGKTVYLRGGRYNMSASINLQPVNSGTANSVIKIFAYENEKPVLDFANQTTKDYGILLNANYWYFKGIEVCNNKGSGISVQGSYNIFEQCVFHHNAGVGHRIGFGHGSTNDGSKAAYNKMINCDSYLNFDWQSSDVGGGADGFTCSLASGRGNEYYGCRSWRNSDDGWDFFECGYAVKLVDCWTWSNGITADFTDVYKQKTGKTLTAVGDGNGFKMGGNHTTGGDGTCTRHSMGTHIFRNCISFGHIGTSGQGITQNAHEDGAVIENCLSFSNKENYRFWVESLNYGKKFIFKNCISFDNKGRGDRFIAASEYTKNSWNLALTGSANDFISLSENDAKADRSADGALPVNFGRMSQGSRFIGKGISIPAYTLEGFTMDTFNYTSLGPQYEGITAEVPNVKQSDIDVYVDNNQRIVVKQNNVATTPKISIYNLKGQLLLEQSLTGMESIIYRTIEAGVYFIKVGDQTQKIIL